MIYSIGYEHLTPKRLRDIALQLNATVVDVRGNPFSRKPGWSRKQLEDLLSDRYQWRGDRLGNKGAHTVTPAGLSELAREQGNVLLLCVEESPNACHRHTLIALPLLEQGIETHHVYQTEIVTSRDLDAANRADTDYDCRYLVDEQA